MMIFTLKRIIKKRRQKYRPQQLVAILFILSLPIIPSAYADQGLTINVAESNKTLHYATSVRLSNVLTDSLNTLHYQPYILGASLVNNAKQQTLDTYKKTVINRLIKHRTFSTEKIISQLKESTFSPREKLSLDNDIVRVFPKKNPLLQGNYSLYLPKRLDEVLVYGAIQSDKALHLKMTDISSLKHYLPKIPFYNVAMKTNIWVIQPNQHVIYIPSIQEQSPSIYLAPGAIIYIGSNDISKTLNQDTVKLLQNRLEK